MCVLGDSVLARLPSSLTLLAMDVCPLKLRNAPLAPLASLARFMLDPATFSNLTEKPPNSQQEPRRSITEPEPPTRSLNSDGQFSFSVV